MHPCKRNAPSSVAKERMLNIGRHRSACGMVSICTSQLWSSFSRTSTADQDGGQSPTSMTAGFVLTIHPAHGADCSRNNGPISRALFNAGCSASGSGVRAPSCLVSVCESLSRLFKGMARSCRYKSECCSICIQESATIYFKMLTHPRTVSPRIIFVSTAHVDTMTPLTTYDVLRTVLLLRVTIA